MSAWLGLELNATATAAAAAAAAAAFFLVSPPLKKKLWCEDMKEENQECVCVCVSVL